LSTLRGGWNIDEVLSTFIYSDSEYGKLLFDIGFMDVCVLILMMMTEDIGRGKEKPAIRANWRKAARFISEYLRRCQSCSLEIRDVFLL
jgi:hypothetical protein